jgi:hypothetical protein
MHDRGFDAALPMCARHPMFAVRDDFRRAGFERLHLFASSRCDSSGCRIE